MEKLNAFLSQSLSTNEMNDVLAGHGRGIGHAHGKGRGKGHGQCGDTEDGGTGGTRDTGGGGETAPGDPPPFAGGGNGG